jgi:hypothetical protein
MQRYVVNQFDSGTFVVFDRNEHREICVCSNYEGWGDAEKRAGEIVALLNGNQAKGQE